MSTPMTIVVMTTFAPRKSRYIRSNLRPLSKTITHALSTTIAPTTMPATWYLPPVRSLGLLAAKRALQEGRPRWLAAHAHTTTAATPAEHRRCG